VRRAPTAASTAEPDLVGANLATAIASDGNLQKQSMFDYPQNPHSSRLTPTYGKRLFSST
jgi:hypothetical protein